MGGAGQTGKGKRPINVKFEIPYFTTSGIQVRYLKIIEPKVSDVANYLSIFFPKAFVIGTHLGCVRHGIMAALPPHVTGGTRSTIRHAKILADSSYPDRRLMTLFCMCAEHTCHIIPIFVLLAVLAPFFQLHTYHTLWLA